MADVRVASRYVKSLLGLAVERGLLEQVHEDMQVLERVFANSRDPVSYTHLTLPTSDLV